MVEIRRLLRRLASVFRSGRAEADLAREIDSHLQLLEDTFVAQGMSAKEARAAARRAFGGVEQAKEHQRDARSFRPLDAWWLDVKLGFRMMIKHPGLTLVGGLGITVAVAIGVGAFGIIYTFIDPSLPLDEGDRIVAIQAWDPAANRAERRILHDFVTWRGELKSVQDLAAFRTVGRNLIAPGVQPETFHIAEMSASGFRVARVPPLTGRHLIDEDEREGAPRVAVIGCDIWRNRFAGDPAVVGRTIQLGDSQYLIVGVMPDGFVFPINHAFWVPLRADASRYERRQGPDIRVFGRLAAGATFESAQAELTAISQRSAALPAERGTRLQARQTQDQLRPRILPYTYPFFDINEPGAEWVAHGAQFLITLLLLVVCVNVAILVYARTATRHGEMVLRGALGASRRRIVAQLFVEALVLTAVSAAAGLTVAAVGLSELHAIMTRVYPQLPFWWSFGLSPGAVLYVVALTVLAAAVIGVLPALKATGRRVQAGLQGLSPGGGSGMRFGRTWTALVVAEVAFSVALLPAVVFNAWDAMRYGTADPGFAAEEFLSAQLVMDRPITPKAPTPADEREFNLRYADRQAEVTRRLQAESAVSVVTFASSVPGEEATVWIEADGVPMPSQAEAEASGFAVRSGTFGHEVRFNRVDVGFFDAFDVPILTGRRFEPGDVNPSASNVIVNRTFVERVLGGRNALGRRIRYVGRSGDARPDLVELGRWYEIVGVVSDFPPRATSMGLVNAKLYHAAASGDTAPVRLAVRVRGTTPAVFAGRLREIAATVDPNLQLRNVLGMDEVLSQEQGMARLLALGLVILTLSVVALSAAGIYALMSFTVAQRRKEIGIRAALGADPRRILGSIFSRALIQLATGALLGALVAALLEQLTNGDLMRGNGPVVLPAVAGFMMLVGLLAAVGPARRGLRIDPTEALRQE